MNLMKSINFEFVRPHRPVLADLGGFAESYMHSDASGALVKLRLLLEECVETIYQRFRLGRPYGREPRLEDLIDADDFARAVNGTMRSKLHALRQSCNRGAHRSGLYTTTLQRVLDAARLAHDIVRWMFEFVGWGSSADLPLWVDPPAGGAAEATKGRLQQEKKEALQQVREKEDALTRALKDLASEREAQAQTLKNLTRTQEELEALRKRAEEVSNALGYNERDTRKYLIDGMLADAGWRLDERARVTVELRAPPDGIADYVLWDESGSPLAVVEAKRAGIDPTVGFTQARGYADALEAKHGRRPVLYCTNGIETWLMDDRSDRSPRRVYGFHERKSLERLVHRRGLAPLTTYAPKAGIADRIYQIEAVKRVLARFDEGSRRALIVQATGTGKTRVAVSLCETLMRAQRAQRILFLCDRRALRDQADQAFNELLPNEPRMVLGVEAAEGEGNKNSSVPKAGASVEKNLHEQRIYLATYPTMMRLRERYDVGFFDLIIADESHRSIYNKYRDLFLYFDALQVGLTATPVGYIDHNTYTLFNCGDQDPTFHYEYDAAVEDGHLVPYNPVSHDTHFLRQGVRWDEMTDAQRARIEASEDDPKAIDYDADQIDRQVMVTGTARAMFSVLMEKGLRDASQSRPGKTVIFARSHKHAMFLAGVFEKQFPEFPKDFCKVIDNHDPRADRLIARFKKLDDVLTLAISVDMLDTGIDVPEIVNLVFARPVRSLVKFLQMLGRGTRLCKNLYGPGKHKTEFVVIDHWHNFEHFSIRRAAREMALSTPLRERIFLARIDVVTAALQRNDTDSFNRALRLVVEDLNALLSSPSLSVRDQHGALAPLCDPERPGTPVASPHSGIGGGESDLAKVAGRAALQHPHHLLGREVGRDDDVNVGGLDSECVQGPSVPGARFGDRVGDRAATSRGELESRGGHHATGVGAKAGRRVFAGRRAGRRVAAGPTAEVARKPETVGMERQVVPEDRHGRRIGRGGASGGAERRDSSPGGDDRTETVGAPSRFRARSEERTSPGEGDRTSGTGRRDERAGPIERAGATSRSGVTARDGVGDARRWARRALS